MPSFQSLPLAVLFALAACADAQSVERALDGFDTNTALRTIELSELRSGGPPKGGIPALDSPTYVSASDAAAWLQDREPVVLLRIGEAARIYPLQILTWHEIVNDSLGGRPVAVTFCPLCYSAIAMDRVVQTPYGPRELSFGVSGLLRYSDMVMYDVQTETLWQQYTGEALVGDLIESTLEILPAQIVSFAQAQSAAPAALVLSRDTGYDRDYGRNPYVGYDDSEQRPFLFDGPSDGRLPPLERIVAVQVGEGDSAVFRAYPSEATRKRGVIQEQVGDLSIVLLHVDGTATALGEDVIANGRDVGTAGVFESRATRPDGSENELTFERRGHQFVDSQTSSAWTVTGEAIAGPLAGAQLTPVLHHDTFAFAWFAFRPQTTLFEMRGEK